jgi:hypothetical protein
MTSRRISQPDLLLVSCALLSGRYVTVLDKDGAAALASQARLVLEAADAELDKDDDALKADRERHHNAGSSLLRNEAEAAKIQEFNRLGHAALDPLDRTMRDPAQKKLVEERAVTGTGSPTADGNMPVTERGTTVHVTQEPGTPREKSADVPVGTQSLPPGSTTDGNAHVQPGAGAVITDGKQPEAKPSA